jgi:gamma-glutamylputrescine oxidase
MCLQGFKDLLVENGMQVFESTEMDRLEDHTAYTHAGSVTADNIIIAVDKLSASISPLAHEAFHAQTFLSVTEPLTDRELGILFPSGEQMQCWDSKLVYSYFRLTGDNRLLLGGGTPITTFLKDAYNNPGVIKRIIKDFRSHFPALNDLSFIQFWPGQIDVTRDLLPVIAKPPEHQHVRFILGCVGIPWATFCGSFAARSILGEADEDYRKYFNYFSNRRHFTLPSGLGKVIGKPALFSLANSWAKFYQVDKLRSHEETEKEF